MSTYKDQYAEAVTGGLRLLLEPIVEYVAEKHSVDIDIDDLLKSLGEQPKTTRRPAPAASKTGRASGRPVATKPAAGGRAAAKPAGKSRATSAANSTTFRESKDGQLPGYCTYIISRGANAGRICNKKVPPESTGTRCRECTRKAGTDADLLLNGEDLSEDSVSERKDPGRFTGAVPDDDDDEALSVVPYEDSETLYISESGKPILFLFCEDETGESMVVIGQLDKKGGIVKLKTDGIKRANDLNLTVNAEFLDDLVSKGVVKLSEEKTEPADGEDEGEEVEDDERGSAKKDSAKKKSVAGKPSLPNKPSAARPPPRRPLQRAAKANIEVE